MVNNEMATSSSKHNVRLTATELSSLWNTYMSDSMTTCFLRYFAAKAEDSEIKEVVQFALTCCEKQVARVTRIFQDENVPIPRGFGSEDVNLNAPRLFADTFYLNYLAQMSRFGMMLHSHALSVCARSDVREAYNDFLGYSREINNKANALLLNKGLYVRAPFISIPEKIDYVGKQSYLSGFFRSTRPLNAAEITHFYVNIQSNTLGTALLIGFSQAAQSQDVRDFFVRGREICKKQIESFGEMFVNDNLPVPMSWATDVTDSTVSPFSDRIMMFHISSLLSVSVLNYGGGMAVTFRRDLMALYLRLLDDFIRYAEDAANLMIKHEWLEEMPHADDRDNIARR